MKILSSYDDPHKATTKILSFIINYIRCIDVSSRHFDIAKEYAPAVISSSFCCYGETAQRPPALAVFDIDDTLIFDIERGIINEDIFRLYRRLLHLGVELHLVTARHVSMIPETVKQLKKHGIKGFKSLSHAPEYARKTMAGVSRWKKEERQKIAINAKMAVTLTVGDQWGDMCVLVRDSDIDKYNSISPTKNFHIIRSDDGVSLWGFKLPSLK